MQIAVFWGSHTVSKYPHLSPCCQVTQRAPTDMEVDVWLAGRQRKSVRHMTSGQAALNEIIILNLLAMNLPSCSFEFSVFIVHMVYTWKPDSYKKEKLWMQKCKIRWLVCCISADSGEQRGNQCRGKFNDRL